MAESAVRCFHPTAKYKECVETGGNTAIARFKGGITGRPYAISYRLEMRNDFARVVLLDDNAAVPPNKHCSMAEWQQVTRRNIPLTISPVE